MLERRASEPRPEPSSDLVPVAQAVRETTTLAVPDQNGPVGELLDYARRVAHEHQARHGKPITRDTLRARLGVSSQLASDLLRTLRDSPA